MKLRSFSTVGLLVLIGTLNACANSTKDNGQTPPAEDTGSRFKQSCASFCQHARDLRCPEGDTQEPPKEGPQVPASCEAVCINSHEQGFLLNTTCRIQASTCAEMAQCQP